MPETFDPYYQWLGIPPEEQPANHYRLLGIEPFEQNPEIIEAGTDRQTVHLRTFQIGPQSDVSQKLLREVAAARLCLLDPVKKAAYDRQLREQLGTKPRPIAGPAKTPIELNLDALMSEAEEARPSHLAPLPRRRKSLRPWLLPATVVLALILVIAALVGVVSWSMGRIRTAIERPNVAVDPSQNATGQPLGPSITLPATRSSGPPPALTGSVEESVEKPLLRTLIGHTRPVCAVAFSPDGKRLATGSKDGSIRLWDAATGQMLWAKQLHSEEVNGVVFSPDGRTLASAGDDRTIRLWDTATGEERRLITGHDRGIRTIAFSPSDRTLASAGHDRTVRLWNFDSGEFIRQWDAHDDSIMAMAFAPDGQILATGALDGSIRLWEPASGRLVRTLSGHEGPVRSLVFSPDGERLFSGAEDRKWIDWEVATGEPIRTNRDHTDRILAVATSPDGTVLATAGRNPEDGIRLWDTSSGELKTTLSGHAKAIGGLAFSPDGKTLVSGGYDRVVKLWQIEPATTAVTR